MGLNLSQAPAQYSKEHQDQTQGNLEREDKKNLKTGQVFDKLLFKDTVTGLTKTVTVASGALVVT